MASERAERDRLSLVGRRGASMAVLRPELLARLRDRGPRRLLAVIAGPGWGKSTLLDTWLHGTRHVRYTARPSDASLAVFASHLADAVRGALPRELAGDGLAATVLSTRPDEDAADRVEALAADLCMRLQDGLDDDLVLAIDDVQVLPRDGPSARLVGAICRYGPPRLHLVVASRDELPFPIERLIAHGEAARIGPPELAFGAGEVGSLLADAGVPPVDGLANAVLAATGGWPAGVRLAIESLRGDERTATVAIEELGRPDGPLFSYLARDVFERETPEARSLLRVAACLDRFSPDLCEAIGLPDSTATIASLVARGMFIERHEDGYRLHDLARDVAQRAWPVGRDEQRELQRLVGAWHLDNGRFADALAALVRGEDWPAVVAVLGAHASALIISGRARAVAEAGERLPPADRSADVARVVGEAYAALGSTDLALEWLEAARPPAGPLSVDLSWRLAMCHYLRDELDAVVDVVTAADPSGGRLADRALLAAWGAGAYRRLGRGDEARALADASLADAQASGDDRALAAAHIAGGFGAEVLGDRDAVARHHRLALEAAQRAGDVLQIVRIRINRGSELLEASKYRPAILELDTAIEMASLAGLTTLSALALMNRGLAKWCLGNLEAASADQDAAIEAYRAAGSRELAYALIGRADVYRERGDLELARAVYEEGLELAEASGDRQALVPALYQLAKVIAASDPERALSMARRAVAYGWPDRGWALVAEGWISLLHGDRAASAPLAEEAASSARAGGDRYGLAEALELRAWAAAPVGHRASLTDAASIWRELGNPLRETIVDLALARLASGHAARAAADAAERRLERLGVRPSPTGPAGLLSAVARRGPDEVEVRTLGGFRVYRAGQPVALAEWQSKKARDLLKLLVTRRGRPTPREHVMDALWPDEDPEALGNRVSVAISILRSTLDPEKRFDPNRYVVTDRANVGLDLDAVAVDLESFDAHAAAGFDLLRQGRRADAADRLMAAEAAYTGDLLEENPYDDWTVSLRDQLRGTYLSLVRALTTVARDAGDGAAELRYLRRWLERDPFDEEAHLGLVAAHLRRGSHGEARAAYRRYAARMDEIDVETAPFPIGQVPLTP